jgi:diketogulonate reductase-like aldo/keto reductase
VSGPAPILTRNIPASGEAIPIVGMGSWQSFDVGTDPAERAPLAQVLRTFTDLGGRVVDSSPMYGRSETVIGDLAAGLGLKDKLFLATKVWTSGRAEGLRQMEDSLRKLGAGTLDLMQVHNLVDVETQLATLREWKAAGRIRYLGVTHYNAGGHAAVARIMETQELDFVQINYSAREREAEKRILLLALDRGIAVLANCPFAGGDLPRTLRGEVPAWAADIACESWAQILLKFVLAHPAITCAIPATSDLAHLRANMAAGCGPLPDAAFRERIARALNSH